MTRGHVTPTINWEHAALADLAGHRFIALMPPGIVIDAYLELCPGTQALGCPLARPPTHASSSKAAAATSPPTASPASPPTNPRMRRETTCQSATSATNTAPDATA